MHRGSCLCGSVLYEITGDLGPLALCPCRNCRKASGSAFNAAAEVAAGDLRVVSGADAMAEYESSPGVFRVFRGRCGSPLFSRRTATPQSYRLRVGTLDTPVAGKPTAQIFASEKAEWFDLDDDIPAYAERP
jgi:hypothetical protein